MLDRNKPYGEVFGQPGVRYVQNGIEYDPQGRPLKTKSKINPTRMSTRTLQHKMKTYNQEWVDRSHAIAWLTQHGE